MSCEESHIFDSDEIRHIASELFSTQCNNHAAIIILGIQRNINNPPNVCKLIVCLWNTYVYGTMLSIQIVFPIIILATHVAVGRGGL